MSLAIYIGGNSERTNGDTDSQTKRKNKVYDQALEHINYNVKDTLGVIWQSKFAYFSYGASIVVVNGNLSIGFNMSIISAETLEVTLSIFLGFWSITERRNLMEVNDFDLDPYDEVAVYNGSTLWIFDENGAVLHTFNIIGKSIASHDLEGDGYSEIFVIGDPDDQLYIVDTANYSVWLINNFVSIHSPVFGDMDGDGYKDIIVVGENKTAMNIEIKTFSGQNYSYFSSLIINDGFPLYSFCGDYDFDGWPEVIIVDAHKGNYNIIYLIEDINLTLTSQFNISGGIEVGMYVLENYYYDSERERNVFFFSTDSNVIKILLNPWSKQFEQEVLADLPHTYTIYLAYNITNYDEPALIIINNAQCGYYLMDGVEIYSCRVSSSYPRLVYEYDKDGDARKDLYLVFRENIEVLISDSTPPEIVSLDASPRNLTVEDPIFVTIIARDNQTIVDAKVLLQQLQSGEIYERSLNLMEKEGNIYTHVGYVIGFPYGEYILNATVKDSFGNIGKPSQSQILRIDIYGVVHRHVVLAAGYSEKQIPHGIVDLVLLDLDGDNLMEAIVLLNISGDVNISIYKMMNDILVKVRGELVGIYDLVTSIIKPVDLDNDGCMDCVGILENQTNTMLITIHGNKSIEDISISKETLPSQIHNITSLTFVENDGGMIPIIGTLHGVFMCDGTKLIDISNVSFVMGIDLYGRGTDSIVVIISNTSTYIGLYNYSTSRFLYQKLLIPNYVVLSENFGSPWFEYPGFLHYENVISSEPDILFIAVNRSYKVRMLVIEPKNGTVYSDVYAASYFPIGIFDYNGDGLIELMYGCENGTVIVVDAFFNVLDRYELGMFSIHSYLMDWNADNQTEFILIGYGLPSVLFMIDYDESKISECELLECPQMYKPTNMSREIEYGEIIGLFTKRRQDGLYNLELEHLTPIELYRGMRLDVNFSSLFVDAAESLDIKVNVANYFNEPIVDAQCIMEVDSPTGEFIYVSYNYENGTYAFQASANRWGIGPVNITITVTHYLYEETLYKQTFIVIGRISPRFEYLDRIDQGKNLNLSIYLYDENNNPVHGSNIEIKLQNEILEEKYITGCEYIVQVNTSDLAIGIYELEIDITNPYAEPTTRILTFSVVGNLSVKINSTAMEIAGAYVQGDEIPIKINLIDELGYPLRDASISALFYGKNYGFFSYGNGTYRGIISTEEIQAGGHTCYITIKHHLLGTIEKNITLYVLGEPDIQVNIGETPLIQNTYHTVYIKVHDKYGYPIDDIDVIVKIANKTFAAKHLSNNTGIYEANISLHGLYHGDYELKVIAQGEKYTSKSVAIKVYVDVKIPELKLSWTSMGIMLVISFIASAIGLVIYYRLTKAVTYHRTRNIEKSMKILNTTYSIVLAGFAATLLLCYIKYIYGSYATSLALVALAIIEILLLSALWIYRDINRNILTEKFERKSVLMGTWHIFVVPVLIYLIFLIGINIEWFAVHIVEDIICIYGYCIPKLLISLITTYIGSYAVIVINIYRESKKVVDKLDYMRKHDTAEEVVVNEKKFNITKLTDSMRSKFLVFLVIIGTTIVSTTKLLQYYTIGLVVAIPILIIFIIPYITAKIFGILSHVESSEFA